MAGAGVTPLATAGVSLPVIRALLDEARRLDYRSGVLGIRTPPQWAGEDTVLHEDVPVRIVACVSALAVREALLERADEQWLVLLTDRPEDDLGAGVLSHLLWHRLRTPDPWEAVRHRFAATGIDPALTTALAQRELATGLLAATPVGGWPPAPGGVLTRDHALAAVARTHLRLGDPDVDAGTVLAWTANPEAVGLVADLRQLAGDGVTDAVLAWIAGRAGAAAGPVLHLLRSGAGPDTIPLGLVVGVLADARDTETGDARQLAREALVRLETRLGGALPTAPILRSWASEAAGVTVAMLTDPPGRAVAERLLARADDLLNAVHARSLAGRSDLLPAGLTERLSRLGTALRTAVTGGTLPADGAVPADSDVDAPLVRAAALAQVEQAWGRVAAHRLTGGDRRVRAFHAAVRLVRWLAGCTQAQPATLQVMLDRHRDSDGWVDSAINDAAPGVGDPDLGAALEAVLAVTRARRDTHDTSFAAVLATHTSDDPASMNGTHRGVWHLEELLPQVVLPLARQTPVLFLILDGMSVGVGTEVVADVLARATDGWVEALLPGQTRRAAALAVLPTFTQVSRASMLCGELRMGGPDVEQRGYATLTRAHGLPGAVLFHKKPLDSSRLGFAVADDVGVAVDDVVRRPLVSCVLNTIDDALDRSDPAGTEWGAEAVKHLEPLLDRARRAGRVVVMTSDHGHVVERRQGTMRPFAGISSGRSRDASQPAGDGEVLVAGRRVRTDDGRAVLAVNDRLRYGPLKAGYHGGAAPAEAVVPIAVLVPGAVPAGVDLGLAPPQEPTWWNAAVLPVPRVHEAQTLFDVAAEAVPVGDVVADAVIGSRSYAAQKKLGGRVSITDDQIRALVGSLLAAPGQRLTAAQAAVALAVPSAALRGAVAQIQRLLNVEGYAVLRVDADGSTLVLDEGLLREQFEVRG